MFIIVGLGNPSKKFQKTRHNIGFRIIDKFKKENKFSELKLSKKFISLISFGFLNNEKIILLKPQTFMNESGKTVKALTKYYKLKTKNLIVIHDDLDLPLGKIKIIKNKSSAGHKGVESIIRELKTKNFIRIRVGIRQNQKPIQTKDFVLEKFRKEEEEILKKVIETSCQAVKIIILKGIESAMNKFNQ